MRRVAVLMAAAMLIGGCGGGASLTAPPSHTPSASTMSPVPVGPTPSAARSATEVAGRVMFDGKKCQYEGPLVMPSGTIVTFTFEPTPAVEQSMMVVFAVRSDVTKEQFDSPSNPPYGTTTPWFVNDTYAWEWDGSSSYSVTLAIVRSGTYVWDRYGVVCVNKYGESPVPYGYSLIQLVEPVGS